VKAGWEIKPLGELCDILDSKRKPVTKSDRVPGPYPYYGATGIQDFVADFIFDEPLVLVGEDGAKWESGESTAFPVQGKYWVNNHAHVVRPFRDRLLDNWLIYFLNHSDLNEYVSGLTVPKLNQGSLREIRIPLAPIEEQRRIVTLLDEAFADIATATANAEKNLQNATSIFENHLQAIFSTDDSTWERKRLGDVFTTATGTTPPKSKASFYGDFIPLVKPPELLDNVIESAPDSLTESGAKAARVLPALSVLVSCIGNLGKIGINTVPVCFNQQINAILPNEGKALPDFMFFQALSPVFKNELEGLASGTTVPIVNKSKFNSIQIALPPLERQANIVEQLKALREETLSLETIYRQKLTALDDLKKSLLHQAFSGQL
jgi:type I restriction enzyme S subunit